MNTLRIIFQDTSKTIYFKNKRDKRTNFSSETDREVKTPMVKVASN